MAFLYKCSNSNFNKQVLSCTCPQQFRKLRTALSRIAGLNKVGTLWIAGAGTASVVAGFVIIMAAVVGFSDEGYFAKYHAELWVAWQFAITRPHFYG